MDQFPLFFGRQLAGELQAICPRPYLVVTMADLWPQFEQHFGAGLGAVHFVASLERRDLDEAAARYGRAGFGRAGTSHIALAAVRG